MPATKQLGRARTDLIDRVDEAARAAGVSRARYIDGALEAALGSAALAVGAGAQREGVRTAADPAPFTPASPRTSVPNFNAVDPNLTYEEAVSTGPLPLPPRRNVGPLGCPEPLCQKRGAKGERCPDHGTLLQAVKTR